MSFRLVPIFRAGSVNLIAVAALALAGCGGGASSSSSGSAGNGSGSGGTAGPVFELGPFQDLASPSGSAAITHVVDTLVIGEHAVLRSDSATLNQNQHLSTRFSIVDGQGKVSASVDYGKTLANGHVGDWIMLPTDGGFALLQAGGGARLYQFDAQARPVGAADGTSLYALPSGDNPPSIAANAAAVDGNGIWVATTLAYPQADKTNIYRLNLTKIDWSGKALTSTLPVWTSTKSLFPHLVASGGAVMLGWSDGGTPLLAVWAQGTGVPQMKSMGAGGGALDFRPLALNGSGKLGLFWNVQSDHSGNLAGLAFSQAGSALFGPKGAADNWDAEVLSSTWGGTRRGLDYDLRAVNGTLYVADVIDDPKASGDTIVLADYTLGDAALSTLTPRLSRTLRATTARPVDSAAVLRQLVFADHTVLLISDSKHSEAAVVTRR